MEDDMWGTQVPDCFAPNGSFIADYEEGLLSFEETMVLFAGLIKSGIAWELQGHYGRTAWGLITNGFITREGHIEWDFIESSLEPY